MCSNVESNISLQIIVNVSCVLTFVVEVQPMNTTVCEGDSATFTCMIYFESGIASDPAWLRNDVAVDVMRHTITSNLTGGTTAPTSISSTITVSNVIVLDDDGMSYRCGTGSTVSIRATLNVVG